MLRSKQAV